MMQNYVLCRLLNSSESTFKLYTKGIIDKSTVQGFMLSTEGDLWCQHLLTRVQLNIEQNPDNLYVYSAQEIIKKIRKEKSTNEKI